MAAPRTGRRAARPGWPAACRRPGAAACGRPRRARCAGRGCPGPPWTAAPAPGPPACRWRYGARPVPRRERRDRRPGDERPVLQRIHDDHGYLQALAGRSHGQRKHGEALDPGHSGDLALGSEGDARADRGRGNDGVGARGLPGRHRVAALHGAAGHRGESHDGEREDECERGQHPGLRRPVAPGQADDHHHAPPPSGETGQLPQDDWVGAHDEQRDRYRHEHGRGAGEQVHAARRGQPLLAEDDQATDGGADQRDVEYPPSRRGDPAAGACRRRAAGGVAADAVLPHGHQRRPRQRGCDDQAASHQASDEAGPGVATTAAMIPIGRGGQRRGGPARQGDEGDLAQRCPPCPHHGELGAAVLGHKPGAEQHHHGRDDRQADEQQRQRALYGVVGRDEGAENDVKPAAQPERDRGRLARRRVEAGARRGDGRQVGQGLEGLLQARGLVGVDGVQVKREAPVRAQWLVAQVLLQREKLVRADERGGAPVGRGGLSTAGPVAARRRPGPRSRTRIRGGGAG